MVVHRVLQCDDDGLHRHAQPGPYDYGVDRELPVRGVAGQCCHHQKAESHEHRADYWELCVFAMSCNSLTAEDGHADNAEHQRNQLKTGTRRGVALHDLKVQRQHDYCAEETGSDYSAK